jgi:hypothetical protein
MKTQTFAPLLVICLTLLNAAHAQVPKLEQKTAFCATSVELFRKRDSSDMYLCETNEHTCGPFLKPSCLDDAKKGEWEVVSGTRQTLLKDFANTPCNCVGTQYVLTRKVPAAALTTITTTPASTPVTTPPATAAVTAAAPDALPLAATPVTVANAPTGSLASAIEGLQQDNLQIKSKLAELQRQFDELRRSLPAAK